MSALEMNKEVSRAPAPMGAELTAIRGKVRRQPEGVEKQQAELLAKQLKSGVPAPYLARQIAIMEG